MNIQRFAIFRPFCQIIVPLFCIVLFSGYCWLDYLAVKDRTEIRMQDDLKILQDESYRILHGWVKERISQTELQAGRPEMSDLVRSLQALKTLKKSLVTSELQQVIKRNLQAVIAKYAYTDFLLIDAKTQINLAASDPAYIGELSLLTEVPGFSIRLQNGLGIIIFPQVRHQLLQVNIPRLKH